MRRFTSFAAAVGVVLAGLVALTAGSAAAAEPRIIQADLGDHAGSSSCSILDDRGRVWCAAEPPDATRVRLPQRIKELAGSCGLARSGAVFCWEVDFRYSQGRTVVRSWQVRLREEMTQITSDCGLGTSGRVWCWGTDAGARDLVRRVPMEQPVRELAGGSPTGSTCLLSRAHQVWCLWGGYSPVRQSRQKMSTLYGGFGYGEYETYWCATPMSGTGLRCGLAGRDRENVEKPMSVSSVRLADVQSNGGSAACGTHRGRLWCFDLLYANAPSANRLPGFSGVTSFAMAARGNEVCAVTGADELRCGVITGAAAPSVWQRGGAGRVVGVVGSGWVDAVSPCSIVGRSTIRCWQGPGLSEALPRPWAASGGR